jgi:hypothetical protein
LLLMQMTGGGCRGDTVAHASPPSPPLRGRGPPAPGGGAGDEAPQCASCSSLRCFRYSAISFSCTGLGTSS